MPVKVSLHQNDASAFHGYVGSGAHGDADIGLGQRGSIVDAIARHRDGAALILKPPHDLRFFLGKDFSFEFFDSKLAGYSFCGCALSPVTMRIRMPCSFNSRRAGGVDCLIGIRNPNDAREAFHLPQRKLLSVPGGAIAAAVRGKRPVATPESVRYFSVPAITECSVHTSAEYPRRSLDWKFLHSAKRQIPRALRRH